MMPHIMWITPRITDIFILNELPKVSLFSAICHICGRGKKREKDLSVEEEVELDECITVGAK